MANPLLDILGGIGDVLSFPGSVVRGGLNSLKGLVTGEDPSFKLTSGRELLGLDDSLGGHIGGFAADVATDPFTWAGGALLRALRGGRAVAPAAASADDVATVLTKGGSKPVIPAAVEGGTVDLGAMIANDSELSAALNQYRQNMAAAPYGGFGDPSMLPKGLQPTTTALRAEREAAARAAASAGEATPTLRVGEDAMRAEMNMANSYAEAMAKKESELAAKEAARRAKFPSGPREPDILDNLLASYIDSKGETYPAKAMGLRTSYSAPGAVPNVPGTVGPVKAVNMQTGEAKYFSDWNEARSFKGGLEGTGSMYDWRIMYTPENFTSWSQWPKVDVGEVAKAISSRAMPTETVPGEWLRNMGRALPAAGGGMAASAPLLMALMSGGQGG